MTRPVWFVACSLAIAALFHGSLLEALFYYRRDIYAHVAVMPLVSLLFLYLKRREIAAVAGGLDARGLPVTAAGALLYLTAGSAGIADRGYYLSVAMFSVLLVLAGCFIFLFGIRSFRAAAFPFAVLLFIIPLPDALLERIISLLQLLSAEASHALFTIAGVPFVRDGFVFHFSGLSIEIAPNCSGIRSSLALLITSVIAGQLLLKTSYGRLGLLLAVLPITIAKNAMRIVALTILSVYVDESWMDSGLHRSGGIVFFILALMLVAGVIAFLRRRERAGMGIKNRIEV